MISYDQRPVLEIRDSSETPVVLRSIATITHCRFCSMAIEVQALPAPWRRLDADDTCAACRRARGEDK